jgi:hypothetical protein
MTAFQPMFYRQMYQIAPPFIDQVGDKLRFSAQRRLCINCLICCRIWGAWVSDQWWQASADGDRGSAYLAGLLLLGLGLLCGWGIGRDRAWEEAGDWAVATTRQCETSYRENGFSTVADCLKGAIDSAEQEKLEEMRADGYDPRR